MIGVVQILNMKYATLSRIVKMIRDSFMKSCIEKSTKNTV